jgi:hypothetical protein
VEGNLLREVSLLQQEIARLQRRVPVSLAPLPPIFKKEI